MFNMNRVTLLYNLRRKLLKVNKSFMFEKYRLATIYCVRLSAVHVWNPEGGELLIPISRFAHSSFGPSSSSMTSMIMDAFASSDPQVPATLSIEHGTQGGF